MDEIRRDDGGEPPSSDAPRDPFAGPEPMHLTPPPLARPVTVGAHADPQPHDHGHEDDEPHVRGGTSLPPAIQAAALWLRLFARTVKTCRLYDAANPTVLRFREELAQALDRTLAEHGPITYRFTDHEIACDEHVVYGARSREDNLAFAFYRDGVRGLTLRPGVSDVECRSLVDSLLAVTGQNLDGDDLVTLLWEANLRHVDVDYIPAEGEAGAESATVGTPDDGAGPLLPWPVATESDGPAGAGDGRTTRGHDDTEAHGERSEDWALGESPDEVEATFAELDFMASDETRRFMAEYDAERRVPPATAALAVAYACLHTEVTEDDRREMTLFLPRVLRAAIAAGSWGDARETLRLLREANTGEWSDETFTQEVLQPVSVTRVVERLDAQGPAAVAEFLALAHELGPAALDWLTLVLSESQTRMTRQVVAEAIAARVKQDPARIAPWLNDPRWYVVRNVVHILGWVGGPAIVPLLQTAVRYPDPRVVAEVVHALQHVELRLARPVLIKAIEGADPKLFLQILHSLSAARDPAVARYVVAFLEQDRFLKRPAEERRAIYAAIASTGGDEVVPELAEQLHGGKWFDREQEIHRHAVARCLLRIDTPKAIAVLEAGAQSNRAPVRQACEAALQSRRAA